MNRKQDPEQLKLRRPRLVNGYVGCGSAAPVLLIEVQTYGPRPVSTCAAGT